MMISILDIYDAQSHYIGYLQAKIPDISAIFDCPPENAANDNNSPCKSDLSTYGYP